MTEHAALKALAEGALRADHDDLKGLADGVLALLQELDEADACIASHAPLRQAVVRVGDLTTQLAALTAERDRLLQVEKDLTATIHEERERSDARIRELEAGFQPPITGEPNDD